MGFDVGMMLIVGEAVPVCVWGGHLGTLCSFSQFYYEPETILKNKVHILKNVIDIWYNTLISILVYFMQR